MHALAAAPQPSRAPRHALSVALVVLVWLVLYLPGLWTPPLLDDADSMHAEAAREMMLRHDWSTLHVNGLRYLEKAPLTPRDLIPPLVQQTGYQTIAHSGKLILANRP